MSEKVKRGLGLLVVALMGALVYLVLRPVDGEIGGEGQEISGIVAMASILCGGYGLVLIAVGLLRD